MPQFYLNQKSLPMIRKCASCRFYYETYKSCSKHEITGAYDHTKKIFLSVGENNYCPMHQFRNEDVLKETAVEVEFETVQEAMAYIDQQKLLREQKKGGDNDL